MKNFYTIYDMFVYTVAIYDGLFITTDKISLINLTDSVRPPLWPRANIVVSHLAGSGSILGRVSFPG